MNPILHQTACPVSGAGENAADTLPARAATPEQESFIGNKAGPAHQNLLHLLPLRQFVDQLTKAGEFPFRSLTTIYRLRPRGLISNQIHLAGKKCGVT